VIDSNSTQSEFMICGMLNQDVSSAADLSKALFEDLKQK
jgi:hypothetical protein